MEDAKNRIKEYVEILYTPTVDADLLDFLIDDVVERFLVFTNRIQFLESYLEAVEEGTEEGFSPLPLPVEVERTLAKSVVNVIKVTNVASDSVEREIVQLNDNGQSIRYSDKAKTAFTTMDDGEVFQGVMPTIRKYILPRIVDNPPRFQKSNTRRFLRQTTGAL